MPVETRCPSCQRMLRVPDELLNRRVKCPSCDTVFVAEADAPPQNPIAGAPGSETREETPRAREDRDDRDDRDDRYRVRDDDSEDDYDDDEDDYESERRFRRRRRRDLLPHRGHMVMTLGIIAVVMFVLCGVFALPVSIPAWVMGHKDLAAMKAQQMEDDGRSQTMTGYIMGIVVTCLSVLVVLAIGLMIAFSN